MSAHPVRPFVVGECVDGRGERTRLGYVRVWIEGRRQLAHRVAYESVHGPVPCGMELDHLCGNRWCRNVEHLEAVTHRVNSQRARNRKLSQGSAELIRAAYRPRIVTQLQLAREYGVSRRTIEQVLKGNFYP